MKLQHHILAPVAAAVVLVAGASRANAPAGRYTTPASGTVYDTKTKLTWQQAVPTTTYTWGPGQERLSTTAPT